MNYDYSMLLKDLQGGREFEFAYRNNMYSIISVNKCKVLCTDDKAVSLYYDDIVELLRNVKIDNKSIEEIFNEIVKAGGYYVIL